MILSQARVNNLLKIFENTKNIPPYDISKQKQEIVNASKFINDYHLYGPPKKYQTNTPNINSVKNKPIISRIQSINSQNEGNNRQSIILSNNIRNLHNYEDIEIHQSITNLKKGQKEYIKNNETKSLIYRNSIYPNNSIYPKYNPKTQSINAYEYKKNENMLNSILGNSSSLYQTQYININNQNNNYYNDYKSIYNYNSSIMKAQNHKKISSLKDIKSNPEDVMITELPPNFAVSMNPLSCTNLGINNATPVSINHPQNNINIITQTTPELNANEKIIEENNIDTIPKAEEINQIQPKEEPALLENLEPQKEPEPEVIQTGKYKITEFNGPINLPANYSTDDEDEFNAIQLINQDISGWKLQKDKDNIKVYSKIYKMINDEGKEIDNVVFFNDATVNFPAKEVNKQLHDFNLRAKWEKSLQKGKILKQEHLPNNLDVVEYYAFFKMPIIFSDRDAVLRSKTWYDYLGEKDCFLSHLKSFEHPD